MAGGISLEKECLIFFPLLVSFSWFPDPILDTQYDIKDFFLKNYALL